MVLLQPTHQVRRLPRQPQRQFYQVHRQLFSKRYQTKSRT